MRSFAKLVVAVLLALPSAGQSTISCAGVTEPEKRALLQYVRQKYKLPDSIALELTADEPMRDTCFHQLTFQGTSTLKKWELKLYLSPDGRYLTTDLFDTTVNPIEEERQKLQKLMAGLLENKGTSLGADQAPVTIVEFSDFECPYCRNFAQILQQVLPGEGGQIRVIFHHMPLSTHPWARTAAQGAACAQLQNSKAFWAFHDQLFLHQSEITIDNIKDKLNDIARTAPNLDMTSFRTCLDNDMSLGLVLRDINLATSNEVTGTPTLFINGHRLQGVKDASQLRQLVAEALKESKLVAEVVSK